MKSSVLVHALSMLSYSITLSLAISLSMLNCQEKCGNVIIPFPFGIGSNCSANSSFTVICRNSTTPILSSINMEVVKIFIRGTVVVKQPVPSPMNCSANLIKGRLPISLKGSPFTISARYNTLAVSGCKNSIWLQSNKTTIIGGCTSMCAANSTETSCNGINCCQTKLPPRLKVLEYKYKTTEASNNDSSCGYVLPVEKTWLTNDYKRFKTLDRGLGFAPLVLEWEFGELKGYSDTVCTYSDDYCLSHPDDFGRRYAENSTLACARVHLDNGCRIYPSRHYCQSASNAYLFSHNSDYEKIFSVYYDGSDYVSSTKYCSFPEGYEGNPYLPEKCIDVDECNNSTSNICGGSGTCINTIGGFTCRKRSADKIVIICIGSGVGGLILLLGALFATRRMRKRIKDKYKIKCLTLLLEQQLSSIDNGHEKTRLFSSKELSRATDYYNENRILGRGAQGTVYKGMLTNGRIVAVKKSKKVEEGDLEAFINEVVILSQINHRNVVKLLGCCLETEDPILVYEFIQNGTLYQHIHDPSEEFPLSWELRARIAREIAGALAYLHSSSSAPIYHRDIKSSNILLDDKYRAKVSDFGISRSISVDQTHLTTRVLGTFGYLDPEYFQSSQFTEKSDVYSFGVVVVELLTGEEAVSAIRADEGWGLAAHFLHSMEENQLFDILDARVIKEGKREEILAIAELSRRCLHPNGKRRPTMKEVAVELEGLLMLEEGNFQEDEGEEGNVGEVDEPDIFSSISGRGSSGFDTITQYLEEDEENSLLDKPLRILNL